MNCRDFLNEFEERNALSNTATLHLNDCVDCRKINAVQTRVWRVIEGFEPVDAPNDFDFRVKARIANAKLDDFQPQFFPALRYVLGLSVIGLILAFVVFNGIYSLDDKTVSPLAENDYRMPKSDENLLTDSSVTAQNTDSSQIYKVENTATDNLKKTQLENKIKSKTLTGKTEFAADKSIKKRAFELPKSVQKTFGGGSQVSSLRTSPSILPKNLSGNQTVGALPNAGIPNPVTAGQILSELGIETVSKNGKWEVKTVKQNSLGDRSGVKVGDSIEAIDGKKLTGEPIRAKTIEGKKLTIMRGAEKKEISLRN